MPTVELLADGLGALVPPMPGRSPGLHVSDVVRDLCLGLGHFEERDLQPTRMQMGCLWERAVLGALHEADDAWQPSPGELELGGLYGTPDAANERDQCMYEVKLTWASAKHAIAPGLACNACGGGECKKGWRYAVQLAAYVHMRGWVAGVLDVTFANGDYTSGDTSRRAWMLEWSSDDLRANWRMLVNRAAQMRARVQAGGE